METRGCHVVLWHATHIGPRHDSPAKVKVKITVVVVGAGRGTNLLGITDWGLFLNLPVFDRVGEELFAGTGGAGRLSKTGRGCSA